MVCFPCPCYLYTLFIAICLELKTLSILKLNLLCHYCLQLEPCDWRICPYLLVLSHWPCPLLWLWRTSSNRTNLWYLEGRWEVHLSLSSDPYKESWREPTALSAGLLSTVSVYVWSRVSSLASLVSWIILFINILFKLKSILLYPSYYTFQSLFPSLLSSCSLTISPSQTPSTPQRGWDFP